MMDSGTSLPGKPTVLLVDDEAELVNLWRQELDRDFEIETAATGEEASLLLMTRSYNLIVSDHMMPGEMQGLEFLLRALQLRPESRRILITGYMNPELIARSISVAQLSSCLMKPIKVLDLRDAMFAALGSRQS